MCITPLEGGGSGWGGRPGGTPVGHRCPVGNTPGIRPRAPPPVAPPPGGRECASPPSRRDGLRVGDAQKSSRRGTAVRLERLPASVPAIGPASPPRPSHPDPPPPRGRECASRVSGGAGG